MPASVLVRLIESRLSRVLRRHPASVLLPFHHASGGENGKGCLGGQYGAASGLQYRGDEVLACNRSDASMFRALFNAILSHPSSGAVCSSELSSSSKCSLFSDASSLILLSSLGLRGKIAPSVKTGVEWGVVIVKRRYIKCPVNLDCAYWFVYWPLK